jgi:hypothetical protein
MKGPDARSRLVASAAAPTDPAPGRPVGLCAGLVIHNEEAGRSVKTRSMHGLTLFSHPRGSLSGQNADD